MSGYRRIVSYLYKYANGKKTENTGFVRVETREDGVRLQIHLKDLKMMDERQIKIYFYIHNNEEIKTVFVDEFLCSRGNCEYKKLLAHGELTVDFDAINGVVFFDSNGLLYGSCWDEREIKESQIVIEKEVPEVKAEDAVREDVVQEEETGEVQLVVNQISEDSPMDQLLVSLPKITLKENPNFIEAVKIDLSDISKLSFKDWKLAENAFLRQGYEAYEYLMFGKIKFQPNQTIWVLGVPGTYDNREKYLANIFGFFDYIPEENSKFRTGGKGYWITRLSEF